ncbi:Hypothetical_protein [Hexamita inflata]|uniref:Hypothetical_protein n=1 Tax=Hexamita inflata TaxID=28002 RepID=A0AA86P170_9EUKA|nr:Hypothetical protein HINF_LOCUS17659 [Hexamita inflata]
MVYYNIIIVHILIVHILNIKELKLNIQEVLMVISQRAPTILGLLNFKVKNFRAYNTYVPIIQYKYSLEVVDSSMSELQVFENEQKELDLDGEIRHYHPKKI